MRICNWFTTHCGGSNVVTYTLNQVPVAPSARFDGASESARIMAEVFERFLEMDEIKHGAASRLIGRMAALASISPDAFRTVLRFGSGDLTAVLFSYADQTAGDGVTRQAWHYRWQEQQRAVRAVFPEIAQMMQDARDSIAHKEGAMSSADALRSSMGGEA